MSEANRNNNIFGPTPALTAKSPDSDVSPRTQDPSKPTSVDYFTASPAAAAAAAAVPLSNVTFAVARRDGLRILESASPSNGTSTGASTATSVSGVGEDGPGGSRRTSQCGTGSDRPSAGSRKSSIASVSFRPPSNPSLPQGQPRRTDNRRLRESSPSPIR
ncbi:hypothetical protein B0T22DRAFT_6323 [Podospora appendiculata]|uniref:Uncharacterized protein n=1 Tax=Podospora appendiculata TaxID=314037 RepID=A0AAE1CF81_9PEZI|nr:hypothetical protein B0T22DRAFT_6323 [Podospora appendiculata]